jgi:ketosteroid isomerase-like protein
LHQDLIVQPPEPDTALGGEAAAEYLEGLARESKVAASELLPVSLSREGGFLLERGGWHLRSGDHTLASRYTLRWRQTPAGWKVVLWRWTLFR